MNKILQRILQIFIVIIVLQIIYSIYSTADKETKEKINFFWDSQTRLIRETFISVKDYILNTWQLIMEKDILEMHKERKMWQTGFARLTIIFKLVFIRTYKWCKAIVKAFLYPVRLVLNLIFSVFKTTFIFVGQIYESICLKITTVVLFFFKLIYRVCRKIFSIGTWAYYLCDDMQLSVFNKFYNIQQAH